MVPRPPVITTRIASSAMRALMPTSDAAPGTTPVMSGPWHTRQLVW